LRPSPEAANLAELRPLPSILFCLLIAERKVFRSLSRKQRAWIGVLALASHPESRASPPDFHHDVAPLIYEHCAPCHRPGGAGPFSLTNYEEVRAQAKKLLVAIEHRVMPPWLPEQPSGTFLNERRLPDGASAKFRDWCDAGMPEGDSSSGARWQKPPAEWELGKPDLLLTFPKTYELEADGPDEYRNFIVPIPAGTNRYVRAFQFIPRSSAIHHARFLFDATGESRRRDALDSICGFAAIMPPARPLPGHILGWTPGRAAQVSPDGSPWPLDGNGELVVQLHLQRTGRRESVRPQFGLYYTNTPPSRTPLSLGLVAQIIEIPAGATNVVISRSLELPGDSELVAIMPHAHQLARECECTATLPGGEIRSLLRIDRWRFNWQDEYRYTKPVSLPRGTVVSSRFRYDNSSANPSNPAKPPKAAVHGPNTTDEMAEMWLQLLPRDDDSARAIALANRRAGQLETVAAISRRLEKEPDNALAHLELAKNLGALGKQQDALEHLVQAVQLEPKLAEAHYYIGVALYERGQMKEARYAFERALEVNPNHQRAHAGLGLCALASGDRAEAEKHLSRALELNPADAGVRRALDSLRQSR
jgi:hypothetical protein